MRFRWWVGRSVRPALAVLAATFVPSVTSHASPAFDAVRWAASAFGSARATVAAGAFVPTGPDGSPPLSFLYGGISSAALLRTWPKTVKKTAAADRAKQVVRWADPKAGLTVTAEVTAFKDFPAVEWVLRFENGGAADTPIIENVQALDGTLEATASQDLVLDQINGDYTDERSYVPFERPLPPGDSVALMPLEGRPSTGTFPMFNVQSGEQGCFVAIGWTGRWAASLNRGSDGSLHIEAGLERTHLVLHPGESIRTPRILLMHWSGDRMDAHNMFRRLLARHYCPRLNGELIRPAIGAQTFNRWAGGTRPEWGTEKGQLAAVAVNKEMGADTLWMDAGWFEGYFPNGAGNWFPRPKDFPNGMKPIGDACHANGMRFLMWYEPERVAPGSQIAREHPEFVLGGSEGGLFNLGDPTARRWIADLLNKQITDYGLDCWRSDFNMDPLPYWRKNDTPDRQGMTETRYVEGLYALWDEIRAKHPHLYIDMCASGGRRLDLEAMSRAIVQTRSDTECAPGRADWEQSQTYGLSMYLPIHCAFEWETAAYDIRSTATAGFLAEWDLLDPAFPVAQMRPAFAEIKENQKYWYGDYYPLTPWTMAPDGWMAWQMHRPDLDAGIVLAFRHKECPSDTLTVKLRGLRAGHRYEVTFIDDDYQASTRTMTAKEMQALDVRVAKPRGSLLVRYKAVK